LTHLITHVIISLILFHKMKETFIIIPVKELVPLLRLRR
jgi:hypothetical protein